jgi:hypothetical protein
MPDLITIFPVATLAISAVIFGGLYLKERVPKKELEDAQLKSHEIVTDAVKQAQTIVSTADLEASKIVSDAKVYQSALKGRFDSEVEKAFQIYIQDFNNYTEVMKQKFNISQQDYLNYIKYLKEESDKSRTESLESIKAQVAEMFVKFEEKLTEFLNETQKSSVESIDMELKATRQLIETYKQNQLKIIDENIIAMLERTLSLVLAKKLSLKDQIDLVYESLEQAKNEKFLI